jgi:hypothetical protein
MGNVPTVSFLLLYRKIQTYGKFWWTNKYAAASFATSIADIF